MIHYILFVVPYRKWRRSKRNWRKATRNSKGMKPNRRKRNVLASSHVITVKWKSSAFQSATIIHNPRHHQHRHMSRYPTLRWKSCKSINSSFLSRELTFHALWISDSWLGEYRLTFYSRPTDILQNTTRHGYKIPTDHLSTYHELDMGIPSGISNSVPRYVDRKRC
jgi:hypothetical protein